MPETKKSIERGQSITFRVPSDTPDYLLKQLQNLKETERRNFSSEIAQYVLRGVNETFSRERESLTIPLPKQLTKEQKSWLKHEHSEALIGTILYQLLQDPVRATSLLASLNSNSHDIDETLYLQEEAATTPVQGNDDDISLDGVNLDDMEELQEPEGKEEPADDDPLADFFSKMNK